MATLKENVNKIVNALAEDKTALTEKEVEVPEGAKHSDVPDLIRSIESGGVKFPDNFKLEKVQFYYPYEWTKGSGPTTTSDRYYYPNEKGYVDLGIIFGIGTEENPCGLVLYFKNRVKDNICYGVVNSGTSTVNRIKLLKSSDNVYYYEVSGKGAPGYDTIFPTFFISTGTMNYLDYSRPIYCLVSRYPN